MFARILFLFCLCLAPLSISSVAGVEAPSTAEPSSTLSADLTASLSEALAWLKIVDSGNYAASWEQGAFLLRNTMKKNEWISYLQTMRKPLGPLKSRQMMDQRLAVDPPNLPKGQYMAIFFKAFFPNTTAYELITQVEVSKGQWKVLTYHLTTTMPSALGK